jgi:GAF domain-containing protein/HAMP domain-containing protein
MAFDNEYPYSSKSQGALLENILANIRVPWKLNLLILVMTIGIVGIFLAAMRGIAIAQNQQQVTFERLSTPIADLNNVDIALGKLQTELILLENPALSPEEKTAHLVEITNAENVVSLILLKYESDRLTPVDLTLDTGIQRTRKKEIQQTLNTLYDNEVSLFVQVKDTYGTYREESKIIYEDIKNGEYDNKAQDHIYNSLTSIQTLTKQLISIHGDRLQLADGISQSIYQDITARLIIALALAIGFGLIFSNVIARSINSRLITLGNDALALQDNLLDRRTNVSMTGKDEIALVARSFNEMSKRLEETFSDLEKKVEERTANLAVAIAESNKRAQQFEAITKVAHSISATQDLQELLPQISKVISEQFGFYHVGIFLNDFTDQVAVLSAANSEGGQRMLAHGHQLKIGEQGIVGFVTKTGQPRIALDVGDDAVFFNNPDLPDTRSEMALPLKITDKVVGALDVQSTEPNAFLSEDVEVLSMLADQVSVAIQNARLFDQIGKALAESQAMSRQYLRETWGRLSSSLVGFRYTASGTVPLEISKTTPDSKPPGANTDGRSYVKVPIQLRGETIGALKVHAPEAGRLTETQMDLIKAVAERVALSVENARLFEETARRAERERRVSDITTKIRSANDPQQMINTAINELRQALGATHIEVVPQRLSDLTDK